MIFAPAKPKSDRQNLADRLNRLRYNSCFNGEKTLIEAVDLFCGVGGLTCGLRAAGITVHAGYDIDSACRYPYESNNSAKFKEISVDKLTGEDLAKWYSPGAIRLLAGCAPCQPFSTLANTASKDEEKWGLLGQFARLVRELKPELVTMENVPRVTNHAPYKEFKETLETLGYHVDAKRVRCADFGIPQERRRFVLVASLLGKISLPKAAPTPLRTVRDAISHLPPLEAGATDATDPLHKARRLTPINLARIKASKQNGTWEDWPLELRAPCHQAESGSSFKSVYARMSWDRPAPTMTTQCFNFGTGRFGHPDQDRAITLREAAILQSFPYDYRFVEPDKKVHFVTVGRMVGNAVPPRLGEVVGQTLVEHLAEVRGGHNGTEQSRLNSASEHSEHSGSSLRDVHRPSDSQSFGNTPL